MGETACRVQCPPPSPLSPAPPDLTLRHAGLQRQRVKYSAHLSLQRLIDDLVLLDAGFAAERLRDHGRRIVVAIAGQIADRHLGVRYSRLDHRFDIAGVHRHSSISPLPAVRIAAGDRRAAAPELSAATLLRHALSHYIPDPVIAKRRVAPARSQRNDRKRLTTMKLPGPEHPI